MAAMQRRQAHEEHDALLADLPKHLAAEMIGAGLSPREVKAALTRIPDPIRHALPKEALAALRRGDTPSQGFGLGGTTGGGKTMALAAILGVFGSSRVRAFQPSPGRKFRGALAGVVWAHWPDMVTWLRAHALDERAPQEVDRLAGAELLVLDDLGRERIKGSYVDDWAASQLDTIISQRYRNELPILWTTNVREADLVILYGAALMRRLTADNPLIWVEGLEVMR